MHSTATPEEIYSNLSEKPNKPRGPRFAGIIRETQRWYKTHHFFQILSWILFIQPRGPGRLCAFPPRHSMRACLLCQDKAWGSTFRLMPGRVLGSRSLNSNCRSWAVAKQPLFKISFPRCVGPFLLMSYRFLPWQRKAELCTLGHVITQQICWVAVGNF